MTKEELIASETVRHATKAAARAAAPHEMYSPVLVELRGGGYDTFPLGYPLPEGAVITEILSGRRWRKFPRE